MDQQKTVRPAWVEIDLNCIDYNIKEIKKTLSSETGIIGVIKADAYGHGAVAASEVLRENGINSFAVATLPEAIKLRDIYDDAQIFVLGVMLPESNETVIEKRIDPAVSSYDYAKALSDDAVKAGKTAGIYIALDTGMGRIGFLTYNDELIAESVKEIGKIMQLPNLKIKGIFSHFATADETDKAYAALQHSRFDAFCTALRNSGFDVPPRIFANSAAILDIKDAHYEVVRLGVIMHGLYPSDEVTKYPVLRPAMSVKARIVHLKTVPAGAGISYGRRYVTEKDRVIATVPVGYSDGYPRIYSPKAVMIVNGHYAPVRGSICMDQCMIDVTDIPDVAVGDTVILMGSDGKLTITPEQIAEASGTLHYEITSGFGLRLEKVYIR